MGPSEQTAVPAELTELLKQVTGFDAFRPGQEEVIRSVLAGRDTIAVLPTGAGKSLCYQLPVHLTGGTVLIVSPLLSLMEDQVARMKSEGEKSVAALNSFLTPPEKSAVLRNLGGYRFIFTSPEMLMQRHVSDRLNELDIAYIVADEAHCISQWGFDFRPDYLRLRQWLEGLRRRPPVLALTATASEEAIRDIEAYLLMDRPVKFIYPPDRPNIALQIVPLAGREEKTEWILQEIPVTTGPGILYVQSRKRAEELAERLRGCRVAAAAFHAGMEKEDRMLVQQQFLNGELEWICATNAFGMGIDKPDVRHVIHDQLPSSAAQYIQEIGRAGRDGGQSLATLLYSGQDAETAMFIALDELPDPAVVRFLADCIASGENARTAGERAGLSETAVRVASYWIGEEGADGAAARMEALAAGKRRGISEMVRFAEGEGCIRERLLSLFGATPAQQTGQCCSGCGLRMEEFRNGRTPGGEAPALSGWKERIGRLFNLSTL
ncbi:RecQ family ATP-dependent DNA helicase [Bhargavaea ullalensis]|uniref:ATP-dependent DNA helicase RecQ n=1 Tax=Bhargavaea ullalensis TaxID=1265685 RepID=A0ABV2GA02_9BACL